MNLPRDAMRIFRAALAAADPLQGVIRELKRHSFARYEHIWVLGAGKATAQMARGVERVLGARITGGLINVKDGHTARLRRIEQHECSHPVPDERGVEGSQRILEIARRAGPRDLVICLISGGGSALLPLPAPPFTLAAKQELTKQLLARGANIHEMNAVRKHVSAIKGGQLAQAAAPATVLTLILSDVIGDSLDVIGSGPTAPDASTLAGARAVLRKYGIQVELPGFETPKALDNVKNVIVGSNRLALAAAARTARQLGYRAVVLSSCIEGETREIARMHAAILKDARGPVCFISGGETTVTLRGNGKGGRNLEFALACAIDLDGRSGILAFSAGTDGTDGPTDAAGAMADGETVRRAGLDAVDYLNRNDSYSYFERAGGLIKTGPTGTNVMDIRLMMAGR